MTKRDKELYDFIKNKTGIEVSKMLFSFILHPEKLYNLNNNALEKIVIEYAPISQKFRYYLDGSTELSRLTMFELSLSCRINNKPALQKILDKHL